MTQITEKSRSFYANMWLNIISDIEEENEQRPEWPCKCNRGLVVTTIFGCDFCAQDFSEWYRKENKL